MSSSCYTVFWFSQYNFYLKSTYELSKMGFSLFSFYPKNNRDIKYSAVNLDFLNKLKSGKNNNPGNIY